MTNLFDEIVNFIDDIKYNSVLDSINKSDRLLWLGILCIIFAFVLVPVLY